MKLTVLVDNNTFIDQYYLGEPALSVYLEEDGKKILFDTGYSDVFIKNAEKMNISLDCLDYLVLSHGHNDHTGGLIYLKDHLQKTVLIAHPDVFLERTDSGLEVGSPVKLDELPVHQFIGGKDPFWISPDLCFLGEIKKVTDFENDTVGKLHDGSNDPLRDDSALAYRTKDGLFIITACSHSGICNICEQARRIFKEDRICGILGGFHLLQDGSKLDKTIQYFKENSIRELWPCHCVSLSAKIRMSRVADIHETGVGLKLDI